MFHAEKSKEELFPEEQVIQMNEALKDLMNKKTIYRPQKINSRYFDKAIEFIQFGAYPNMENTKGETLLYQAIAVQNLDAVKKLIKLPGIDLNKRICLVGSKRYIKMLIQQSVDFIFHSLDLPWTLHFRGESGFSPVWYASQTDQIEILNILIDAGAKMDSPYYSKPVAAWFLKRDIQVSLPRKENFENSSRNSEYNIIEELFYIYNSKKKKEKQDTEKHVKETPPVSSKDYELQEILSNFNEEWTHLPVSKQEKIFSEHFSKCINLVEQGANPNISAQVQSFSCVKRYALLHQAVISKQPYWLAKVLNMPNIDPNVCDNYGKRPIHLCVRMLQNSSHIMKLLCKAPGIDLNAQDAEGNTPMYYLIKGGCLSRKSDSFEKAFELWHAGCIDLDIKNKKGISCRNLLRFVPGEVSDFLKGMIEINQFPDEKIKLLLQKRKQISKCK